MLSVWKGFTYCVQASLDHELQATSLAHSFARVSEESSITTEADTQFNLISNVVESIGQQGGTSGPATNLLQDMGVRIPVAWLAGSRDDASYQASKPSLQAHDLNDLD